MTWLLAKSELKPEQKKAVELPIDKHQLITGPPGSGKTQILVHRAHFLYQQYKVKPTEFRIFVFTNVLKDYIKQGIELIGLPEDNVLTFDYWCKQYYQARISGRLPWDSEKKTTDFAAVRKAVRQHVEKLAAPLYVFVMVDEGQDLDQECFEILRRISRHVTVCMDTRQQIYSRGANESLIRKTLHIEQANVNLLKGFRCSPYIISLAKEFITGDAHRTNFGRELQPFEFSERQTPLLYYAASPEDEKNRLYEMLIERQQLSEKIGVLFSTKKLAFGWAMAMRERDLQVENPDEIDFLSGHPKFMSYHSAKGLAFDTVFLPSLTSRVFKWVGNEESIAKLVFVGITRARKWVYLSTREEQALNRLTQLKGLVDRQELTIQRGVTGASSSHRQEEKEEDFVFEF